MKKINLIEWLSRNSHEKQKPQRFARYAAMLIMLLTLGVGQMWAGTKIYFKNTGSWSNVYCHYWGGSNGSSWPGTKMNQIGSTQYYVLDVGNNTSCLFQSAADENKTSDQTVQADQVYVSGDGWKSGVSVDNYTIYFDCRNVTDWATPHLRIGRGDYNSAYAMSKVAGTQYLYSVASPGWENYTAYTIANSAGWTGGNTIYQPSDKKPTGDYAITKLINYQSGNIVENKYITPSTKAKTETDADYWNVTVSNSLPSYTVSYSKTGTGDGTLTVTKYNGSSYGALSSGGSVLPTQIIKIEAEPNGSSVLSSLSVSGATRIGETNTYYVTANTTITATFNLEEKHNVTVLYVNNNSQTIKTSTTESNVGVSTTSSVTAPSINDHTWTSWTLGDDVTSTNGTSTNPIIINTVASGSDFTLQANYTLVKCTLCIGTSSTFAADGTTYNMSYDPDVDAYYYDLASSPANLYFRFKHATGPKYWSSSWNGSYPSVYDAEANGSKIICTDISNYDNKSSIHFPGITGSPIRIWFDFQNKEAWITETKYTVTTANDGHGTASPASVQAGKNTLSGNITASAATGYTFDQWTVTTGGSNITLTSATANPTTVKATSAGTVRANFKQRYVLRGSKNGADATHGGMAGWSADDNSGYSSATISDGVMTITANLTLAKTKYKMKIRDIEGSGAYYSKNSQDWTSNSNATLNTSDGSDITFTTTAPGTYTFTFNCSTKNLALAYPSVYTVTYGYNTGGSSVTATVSGNSIGASPGYAESGSDVVLSYTKLDGYDFKEWNTASNGSGTKLGTGDTYTISSISANKTVYAIFTPQTYTSVKLDKNGGSTDGAYSVTYKTTSISITTTPAKTGYHVDGYYKQAELTNLIATSAGALQASTSYTDGSSKWTQTSGQTLYTKWAANTHSVTLDKNGSYTSNGSATSTYDATSLSSITAPTRTGYHVEGYYDDNIYSNKVATDAGALQSDVTGYTTGTAWTKDADATLYAKWTANEYTITFAPGAGASVDPTSASVTYDATISNAPVPTKTGYTFTGYNTAGGASITTNTGVFKESVAGFTDASAHWIKADDATITAQWSANTYNVVFNKNDEGATGTMSNQVLTYDADATALTSNAFAKNGYAFAGWATAADGDVVYADGAEVSNLATSGNYNLYAKWTKVTLTDFTFSPAQAAPGATVTATPVLSGTPTGNSVVCWGLYYDAECNSAVPGATFTSNPSSGSNAVTFTAPATSGTYYVQGIYRAGTTCDGTEHNTYVEAYTLASAHTATIKYVCGGTEISARGSVTIPAGDSVKIGPKEIIGYTFSSWSADPVITLGSRDGDSVKVGATYDGIITATYTRANMILFKDELGWTDPEDDDAHVYLNLLTASRWDFSNSKGSGNKDVTNRNLEMNRLPGTTDVFYYLYENKTFTHVSFTDRECIGAGSAGQEYFWSNDAQDADKVKVVYPTVPLASTATADSTVYGFNAGTPMFVPLASQDGVKRNNNDGGAAMYYNKGYWRWYDPYITDTTGYSLLFYSGPNSGSRSLEKTVAFTDATGDDIFETTVNLEAQTTYYIKFLRDNSLYYTKASSTLSNDEYQEFTQNPENYATANFKSSAAGDYIFRITIGSNGRLKMKVVYPAKQGDYRVVYKDLATWSQGSAHTASWCHPSRPVHKEANAKDIVSFYVNKAVSANASMKFQYASAINAGTGAITWTDVEDGSIDISSITESGVYNFYLTQDENGDISVSDIKPYTGNYYIRTNSVTGKWSDYKNSDHLMPYSDYSFKQDKDPYSHYLTQWVTSGTSISFTVANDYSSCISDTLIQGVSEQKDAAYDITNASTGVISSNANVRFMYNQSTNKLSRAYISGSTNISDRFLVLEGSAKMYDADGKALSISGLSANQMNFTDKQNWIYEATVKANPGANVKLTAKFNEITQYLKGGSGADSVALLGGTGTGKYKVQVVYDFKINRLVTAWVPDNNEAISDSLKINADVMIVRNHQENPDAITFSQPEGKGYGALTDVKTVYGVMTFNRWTLNNRAHPEDVAVAHCAVETPASSDNWVYDEDVTNKYHPVLTEGNQKSIYERCHYYISFPFDVKLSDVFGFGTYWDEWYLEYYDGKARAKNGYWIDSKPNWKYVTTAMKNDFVMKAYEGYILGLDLDFMEYNNTSFWSANSSEVSLYFPSTGTIDTISHNSVTVHIDTVGYTCTINRGTDEGDRRIKDSHWHCIGVPSYAALAHAVQTSDLVVDWSTQTVPYVYNWNMTDNTLTPVSASGSSSFTFQPMHAYLVQYAKPELTWSAAATTPIHSVVARSEENDVLRECEFRLELQQNDAMTDQTYIRLTTDEAVTTGFEFNYDLVKELNGKRSNIYTLIGYEKAAANMLPFTEQTTVVPVGVKIVADGEYTFSIPDGTSGVGVTLIDNVLNTRTNLGLMDYTVNLEAGTIDGRFMIEISPVQGATTGIENSEVSGQDSDVRKVIIDQKMYIIKGDRIYDATGAMVK